MDAEEKKSEGLSGYTDYLEKEIAEQPRVIAATLEGRVVAGDVKLSELTLDQAQLAAIDRVIIIGCGTSYHAGLVAKELIEKWARIPVDVRIASEFKYSDPILSPATLVVAITQSGETADILGGIEKAKSKGARVFAITNVADSTVARASDGIVYTAAGPELSIAATKSFTSQLVAVYILALFLAQHKGALSAAQIQEIYDKLQQVPGEVQSILDNTEAIEEAAAACDGADAAIYLGRNVASAIALEGALKCKEVNYIHAQAYPAGEFNHGPIALVEEGLPVVVLAPSGETFEKTLGNIKKVSKNGATTIVVTTQDREDIRSITEHVITVPMIDEELTAISLVVPLQVFARTLAVRRGRDIDHPRNLEKAVTEE